MEVDTQRSYATLLDEMVTYSSLTLPDAQTNSHLQQLRKSAAETHKSIFLPTYPTPITLFNSIASNSSTSLEHHDRQYEREYGAG